MDPPNKSSFSFSDSESSLLGDENENIIHSKKRPIVWNVDSGTDVEDDGNPSPPKRKKRQNVQEDSCVEQMLRTLEDEKARRKRIAERRTLFNSLPGASEKLVLDYNVRTKEELVVVHPDLVKKLKSHQVDGVKFMWDSCFESLERLREHPGGGCILAHSMGLGKTFQVVTLVHTLLTHKATNVNSVLIICPVNTILNWRAEFEKWLPVDDGKIRIYDLTNSRGSEARAEHLEEWKKIGRGVMIIGYEMFRTLVTKKGIRKNVRSRIFEALIYPGADLVICDEGHVLKNDKTALAQTVTKIKTSRRIVLTGTPLQNNLIEYYCMINFIKPNLLGTKKEFLCTFADPISRGQFNNSSSAEVEKMRARSYILHQILEGVVQRCDSSILKPYLPPKYEFVIFVGLSELMAELYEYYLDKKSLVVSGLFEQKSVGKKLFADYQKMRLLWTHPLALKLNEERRRIKAEDENSDRSEDDEDQSTSSSDDSDFGGMRDSKKKKKTKKKKDKLYSDEDSDGGASISSLDCAPTTSTGVDFATTKSSKKDTKKKSKMVTDKSDTLPEEVDLWWQDFISEADYDDCENGPKLILLFDILKECELIGDKLLLFSNSLPSLDMIEYFLKKKYSKGIPYFRIDGQTSIEERAEYCSEFNDPQNDKVNLFLISTKAGGIGINLTAANRVILFDASWNPSHDIQSIFRVYRFGQMKPCFIYRFISQGTMEEKLYNRQVIKLSISRRVIDEEQIDRHFTLEQIAELYKFSRDNPMQYDLSKWPNDNLMAGLLERHKDIIINYHEHDSLLENNTDQEFTEEERRTAEKDYEEIKSSRNKVDEEGIDIERRIREKLKELNPTASESELEKLYKKFFKIYAQALSTVKGDKVDDKKDADEENKKKSKKTQRNFTMRPHIDAGKKEDPEMVIIKEDALLHLLRLGIVSIPKSKKSAYTWILKGDNKDPKSMRTLFLKGLSSKQKLPRFDIKGDKLIMHLSSPHSLFRMRRFARYGITVIPVIPDLATVMSMIHPDISKSNPGHNHNMYHAPDVGNSTLRNKDRFGKLKSSLIAADNDGSLFFVDPNQAAPTKTITVDEDEIAMITLV